jgi:uncharacterized membrane protein
MEDDLDGGDADETVQFAVDGASYEIDLSTANASKLRDALAKYVGAGRKVSARGGARTRGRAAATRSSGGNTAKVREWARANGYEISDRGRVPANILTAYEQANN